jgi:cytidine deaminase
MGRITEDYGVKNTALEIAKDFREDAYAPYSNYKVGACAVAIGDTGTVHYFAGSNVENASYGMTICAERVAIFNAVANGLKNIPIIAIATENGGMSCGACRQVEYEFNSDMLIVSTNDMGEIVERRLSDLLPDAFGPNDLEQADHHLPRKYGYKRIYDKTESFIGERRYE